VPVGYKRYNKKTGKDLRSEDIVKGIEYEPGQYVVISTDELRDAYPKTTQTIEIESFVRADAIPFVFLERLYYVAPINKGAKVYALLRDALLKSGKIGVAKVVIQTRQHLAALVPAGNAMILNLLRWNDEVRPIAGLDLPPAGAKAVGISDREMTMAEQLINDMSADWQPDQFTDSFKDQILKLVEQKVKAGKTQSAKPIPTQHTEGIGATIIDLSEMLRQSLEQRTKRGSSDKGARTNLEQPSHSERPGKKPPTRPMAA
jgi:DNA end-binding protein Ku